MATIAIIGGTGALGSGLARLLSGAGHEVLIGSRDETRGLPYADAASAAEIIILTVPFACQGDVAGQIAEAARGKIVVDATVPLVPPKVSRVQLPPEGAAALRTQAILGESVRVVSALQNVAARHLSDEHDTVECDVLVTGDDPAARESVIGLLAEIGLRGLHAGPLVNAAAAEAMTSLLIFMNRHYKTDRAGIKITGL